MKARTTVTSDNQSGTFVHFNISSAKPQISLNKAHPNLVYIAYVMEVGEKVLYYIIYYIHQSLSLFSEKVSNFCLSNLVKNGP